MVFDCGVLDVVCLFVEEGGEVFENYVWFDVIYVYFFV